METCIISLETVSATNFVHFFHLHSSKRTSPLSSSYGGRASHSPSPQPLISLLASQSFLCDPHSTALTDLSRHMLGVCDPPRDKVNVASMAMFETFVVCRDFCAVV